MSWPMVAFVDAFDPVAPAVACGTSALSEAALLEPDVTALNRSVMPDGAPMAELPERPKQATSIVFATVVVIDGAEELTAPLEALMGLVVSTLKYALIPPTTLEEETVKAYGPGSAAAVPATFQRRRGESARVGVDDERPAPPRGRCDRRRARARAGRDRGHHDVVGDRG